MGISIISFTEQGIRLSVKAAGMLGGMEHALYTRCSAYFRGWQDSPVQWVDQRVGQWAGEQMEKRNALLFIGACGIAVRAIAPNITGKLRDSPVLVMDEKGQYVIPLLSGHVGGANELAMFLAEKMGASPVITTATDLNDAFAADIFAKKQGLFIENPDGIAKVSSKVLSGQMVSMSVQQGHMEEGGQLPRGVSLAGYPPAGEVDIVITSERRGFDARLLLRPREYVIGMGCRRGKEAEKIEALITESLKECGIFLSQVDKLASIDLKSSESGLLAWSRKEHVPFVTFTAEELNGVEGDFQGSDFVKAMTGVDNVCERAALMACGSGGRLVYGKHREDGMTIAIAKKKWSVKFDET